MKVVTHRFTDDGDIPNHPHWPMIVYHKAFSETEADAAAAFEAIFARHGWGDGWRNGIFAFPHYHSNAHEVLGIAQGEAIVRFGGNTGREFKVRKGDAVLLPAGTGHQRLLASADLLVIGAYPPGPGRDLMRSGEPDKARIRERVRKVPKPVTDPLAGKDGPLISFVGVAGFQRLKRPVPKGFCISGRPAFAAGLGNKIHIDARMKWDLRPRQE